MPASCRLLLWAPAAVVVLLALAWVVSLAVTYSIGFAAPQSPWQYELGSYRGSLFVNYHPRYRTHVRPVHFYWFNDRVTESPFGRFASNRSPRPGPSPFWQIHAPFLVLITVAFPLAIGALNSFRFRIWHYLAYTALCGLELAYYLR